VTLWQPDPTFYPSPRAAISAPPEKLAYVALLNGENSNRHDALGVVDVDPASSSYGRQVGQVDMPHPGDELHHFGWNACSACLSPYAPHPHTERRYLIVPGIRSSRIHVIDTKPNPRKPEIIKVIEPETLAARTGYSKPHTVHCGPAGVFVSALGAPNGEGPGGIFVIDPESFDVLGKWEIDRGPQYLAYDFWWHLGYDTLITSEWGTPNMVEKGVNPDLLLKGQYGHALHVWDLRRRRHIQTLDLGAEQQMVGAAPGARSCSRVRFCRRGRFVEGPIFFHMGLASRQWKLGGSKSHRDSRRARRSGIAAAAIERLQGRSTACD